MIPYFHALFIQRHGMISALMIYGPLQACLRNDLIIMQYYYCLMDCPMFGPRELREGMGVV